MRRLLLVILALSLLLTGCGSENVVEVIEPESTNPDSWRYAELYLDLVDELARGADWEYTNKTHAFRQELIPFYKKSLDKLQKLSTEHMDPQQRVNRGVFEDFLIKEIQGEKFICHDYFINQFNGIPVDLPTLLAAYPIPDKDYARYYRGNLMDIPQALKNTEEGIKAQIELGIAPPYFVTEAFMETISEFLSIEPVDNILYTTYAEKTKKFEGAAELHDRALTILTKQVYPAYQDFYQFLLDNQAKLKEIAVTAGVWQLPQGDEYYAHLVRVHTTTDLTPQEVHDIGLREVDRIHKEISEKLQEMGLGDKDPVAYLRELSSTNLVSDKGEILSQYRKFISKAKSCLPEFFSRVPDSSVVIREVPAFRKATFATAYSPAYPGQPGTLLVEMSSPHPRSDIEATVFHETWPGHHLQSAWLLDTKFPAFREWVTHSAYKEGWALYAERLMYENGCYSDSYSELGYLHSELFRAARLVIDTGIHYKRWTREVAIDYLWEAAGIKDDSEIDRYIVWPGQALAYKIGELKILELREMAREQLGDKFDIKEFHDVILNTGSVPLHLLEEEVMRYIEEKLSEPEALLPTAPFLFKPLHSLGGTKIGPRHSPAGTLMYRSLNTVLVDKEKFTYLHSLPTHLLIADG
jgi:uncharacterized protein (DUF885 family)